MPDLMRPLCLVLLGSLLALCRAQDAPLVIRGTIRTMDRALPVAGTVVLRRGTIESVGGPELAASAMAEPGARLVELPPGAVALPGIIESHAHFRALGAAARQLDLRNARSLAEAQELVRAAAAATPSDRWILGRGWNQEIWPEKAFPDAAALDACAPSHKVALTRIDGHAVWVNSAVLAAAGVSDGTPSPQGGEIIRDASGRATGILVDAAADLVSPLLPGSVETFVDDCLAAQAECLASGITTFVDAGISLEDLLKLHALYQDGLMKLRLYEMIGVGSDAELERATASPPIHSAHQDRVAVRALKIYADGALGSRGAWLLEEYADRAGHLGLSLAPPGFLDRAARRCLERGWQMCVHAIGDRACREVLDAVDRALKVPPGGPRDHRFRVEHAQIVAPADVLRFARLGVIPSMQACHAVSDGPWVPDRIGEARARERSYPWRALLDAGCPIPNGTDAPVEILSPWRNYEAAVFRHLTDPGQDGSPYFPEQRMNRYEGLLGMTVWGAHGIFAENRRGRIRPGFDADLCVVDKDPLTTPVSELRTMRNVMTVLAGEIVYRDGF